MVVTLDIGLKDMKANNRRQILIIQFCEDLFLPRSPMYYSM